MDPRRLPVQSRAHSVVLVLGVVLGLLVAGLAIPFAFGERLSSDNAAGDDSLVSDLGEVAADAGADPGTAPAGEPGGAPSPDAAGAGAATAPGAGAGAAPGAAGGSRAGGAGAEQAGAAAPGAPLAATDRGVTASTIKLGFTALDTANLSRVGVGIGVTVEQQIAAWQAYVKDINARGGIHGRKVQGVFASYDPTNESSQRQACLRLTQDEKVYAVVGGFNYPVAVSCVARENKTLLFSGYPATSDELYAQSEGRFITMYPRASRMMALTAAALDSAGKLKGRTIGIVTHGTNDPGGKTARALEAALKARGHNVKRRAELSSDTGTASSQVPVTVGQFQRDGVNTVFMLASVVIATQFVQQADSQAYRPAYHFNDWANNNNDFTVQNMPRSFEGTIGVTHIAGNGNKVPAGGENAGSKRCREVYEKHSGRKLAARGTAEYGATTQACDTFAAFERVAKAAGPNLTRVSASRAVGQVGAFPVGNWGAGAFGQGKPDFTDQLRFQVFRSSCSCWQPSGGFFSPR